MDEGEESAWRDTDGTATEKPHAIVEATGMLFYVQHYLARSSLAALLLLVICEYTKSINISVVFYLLLLGQTIGIVQIGRVVHCAVQPLVQFDVNPLIVQSRRDRRTWTAEERTRWADAMQWQTENSELLLLLQKTIIASLWIFVILVCFMSAEMTALWGNDDYSWIIPLYAIGGIRLVNSVLCISMPIIEIVSLLLAICFLIFFNVKEVNSSVGWSWTTVSIPMFVLLGAWALSTGYTLVEYIMGIIVLRTRQVEALVLYLSSFALLISCIVTFDLEMEKTDNHGGSSLLLFFGAGLLFMGMHISTMEALDTLVERSGASRPLPLTQAERDIWEVDESKMPRYSILIGEYELRDPRGTSNVSSSGGQRVKNDSCLLSHALLFLRTLDRVLLLVGIDCLGCVDDSKDRRAKSMCSCCCEFMVRDASCSCMCCGGSLELLDQNSEESAPMLCADSS
jgi:hypothetical protein